MEFTTRSNIICLIIVGLASAPVAAWALWKPFRVLAPSLANVICYEGDVCVDNPAKLDEAKQLRANAIAHVEAIGDKFQGSPRTIFCTTPACDQSFGFKGNIGYSFGAFGLVIASQGWQSHIVRHELIHCLQVEHIGSWRMLFITPKWLIEGMAYSASEDPRRPLAEPWESFRTEYEEWSKGKLPKELWAQARAL